MKLFLAIGFIVIITSVSRLAAADEPAETTEALSRIAVISVSQFQDIDNRRPVLSSVTFNVDSHGCTKTEDFDIDVKPKGEYQMVSVYRTKPDNCNSPSASTSITIATDALAAHTPILVRNPLYASVTTTRSSGARGNPRTK
jgi:hypothetical protein